MRDTDVLLSKSAFMGRRSLKVGGTLALFALIGPPAMGQVSDDRCTVSFMQAAAPADTVVTSAKTVREPVALCKVEGYSTTVNPGPNRVAFGLQLPPREKWNNRFYFIGVGGSGGGAVPSDATFAPRVAAGWATAGTDKGHPGVTDWSFANDPAKALDNAHRGAHVSTVAAQALTRAYYDASKMYRYHTGCSGGGDMGFKALREHPGDYDGVLLGWIGGPFPDYRKDGTIRNYDIVTREVLREPGAWISPAKRKFVDAQVLAACDAADGAKDDLVQDTRQCKFDFRRLQCKGADDPTCLTRPEVITLTNLVRKTSFPISNIGSWGYLGNVPPPWTPSTPGLDGNVYSFLNGWAQTYLQQPDRDVARQPLSEDEVQRMVIGQLRAGDSLGDALDIAAYEKLGGKAVFYVGIGDPAFPHVGMENYFNLLTGRIGAPRVDAFARLYQVPGWGHCGGGNGPTDGTDRMLEALINWVEKEQAPSALTMHRGADRAMSLFPSLTSRAGQVEVGARTSIAPAPSRDFLVCPYPQLAVFDRTKAKIPGAVYEASNWTCRKSPYLK